MAKISATYQQLQEIIANPGCPICGLVQRTLYTYLDTLLWESSTDENLQAMMVASLGFCGRHSRQLLTFGGQRLAAAVVERAALLATMRRLPELAAAAEPPPARLRLKRAFSRAREGPPRPHLTDYVEPCPACMREATEEVRGINELVKHLDEFSVALFDAGGLCLPHFVQAAHAANASQRSVILQLEQQILADLSSDLEEFIRQHMIHHHGDPITDRARLAVERTIACLTGEVPAR